MEIAGGALGTSSFLAMAADEEKNFSSGKSLS
jgi:hypothetical protein